MKKLLTLICLFLFVLGCNKAQNYDLVQSGFENPTDDNNLWCYWYWINDDISKDGITKDLEAMKKE